MSIIDDDNDDYRLMTDLLDDVEAGLYETRWLPDFESAIADIKKQEADVYLIDFRLGEKTGLDVLDALKELNLDRPMILLTGAGDRATDFAAMEKGAADFLRKNQLSAETLERSIRYSMKSAQQLTKLKAGEKILIEKEAAVSANLAKSRFLAHMSHEIRTPLTAMLGFAELAKDPQHDARERNEFLGIIKRSGDHLLRVINDILDLAKVEDGAVEVAENVFNIADVIDEVLKLLAPIAEAKSIGLEFVVEDRPSMVARTDSHLLRQILVNIIGNAIKFTSKGRVSVDLRGSESVSRFIVSVSDTGIGIDVIEQERLFRPFSQANSSLSRTFGGTGLGLDLSKKLASLIGGDVRLAQSEFGKGSTFVLSLPIPLKCTPADAKNCNSQRVVGVSAITLGSLRVLIAEDSKDNQLLLKHYLSGIVPSVSFADDGFAVVRDALAGDFDVVLMDIQMPGRDGYEATHLLREAGYTKPIIALTAHALKEERAKALGSGFTDFVSKPISRDRLLAALARSTVAGDPETTVVVV